MGSICSKDCIFRLKTINHTTMNSTPPPIRPQGFPKQQPPMVPSSGSGSTLILLSGIGLLVIFLIEFIRTIIDVINMLDYASFFGPGWLGEYFLASNYGFISLIFFAVGGIAILSKKKIGWSFGFAATGFSFVLVLYLIGASIYFGSPLVFGTTAIRLIALILTTLVSIAVFIVLLLPDTRKGLKVGATEIGIGAGMLGFLIIDFIVVLLIML